MLSFILLSVISMAGVVRSLPAADFANSGHLSIRSAPADSNCTVYSSPSAGTVCILRPSDCSATYLVQSGDNCGAIGGLFNNFTLTQFYKWNPDIGQTCLGLQAFVPVCINTPWYTFVPPVQAPKGTVVDASTVPVPIMPQIIPECKKFQFVGSGMRVDDIVQQNNISLNQFLAWNKGVSSDNLVVWANYWVCVAA